MERWENIKGFENYQVSSYGRVKGKKGILKPILNVYGYYQVMLYKNKKAYSKRIHRLVLEAFEPEHEPQKNQVNHIDLNKTNNNINNLEWITSKDNCIHVHKNKKILYSKSQKCFDEFGNKFESYRDAGRYWGISPNTVKNDVLGITKRKTKKRKVYFFKYNPKEITFFAN